MTVHGEERLRSLVCSFEKCKLYEHFIRNIFKVICDTSWISMECRRLAWKSYPLKKEQRQLGKDLLTLGKPHSLHVWTWNCLPSLRICFWRSSCGAVHDALTSQQTYGPILVGFYPFPPSIPYQTFFKGGGIFSKILPVALNLKEND